jgi:hypothetical protein
VPARAVEAMAVEMVPLASAETRRCSGLVPRKQAACTGYF